MPEVWSRRRIKGGEECEINSLEHVEVKVSFSYSSRRGNLILLLESPAGTKSYLMTNRPWDSIKYSDPGSGFWYFSSVHFWGEKIDGTWKLTAKTDDEYSTKGKWKSNLIFTYRFNLKSNRIDDHSSELINAFEIKHFFCYSDTKLLENKLLRI